MPLLQHIAIFPPSKFAFVLSILYFKTDIIISYI